ncbi:MAG: hypothetical protein HYR66_03675 [Sphingobacteriales bacterium]|nr:hypothetical protein [Sphingobacteriales bacterium]MBI3717619.1 hypothetical protein [Sphingobacteriales bacterium]
MNKKWISRYWWLPVFVSGIGLSSFTLFNFADPGSVAPPQPSFRITLAQLKDTAPSDEDGDWQFHIKTGELDKAIAEMEKQIVKAKTEFKKQDWKKIDEEMEKAMKEMDKVDLSKMKLDLEQQMKNIDFEKMEKELKESLKKLEEVDLPKMKKEMQEQLTKELAAADKELANSKKELQLQKEKMKGQIGKNLAETMQNLDKVLLDAKEQLKEFKKMTEEMEKDGLIKKGENADVTFRHGELYINGKKQSKEVSEKYKHYFKKGGFHFEGKDDDWL